MEQNEGGGWTLKLFNKRKKRSDKLYDVKIKLSAEEKKQLQILAMDEQVSLTAFCSEVAKRELKSNDSMEIFEYDNSGHFVHVLLPEGFRNMVQTLSIEWSDTYNQRISQRRVVHTLIKNYLWKINGGIKIMFYNN